MERKKVNIGSCKYSFQKRLKKYLDNAPFGTELSFIPIEIKRIEGEIYKKEKEINVELDRGNPDKIQGTDKIAIDLNYHSIIHNIYIEYKNWLLERKKVIENSGNLIEFIPETNKLKEWIMQDYITKFTEIEIELFNRGFIDIDYKWKKYKTLLADFVCVISEYNFIKRIVKGKQNKPFHKRQFLSDRYGFGKTGLTETNKKYKPKFENSVILFSWITKPE